ncbi:MAG TPA: ABC transporter substrate-binding protein [Candidatus Nitrosocosmicus sp.]|nr:ABC transporter substrate-binding protein [Candidatus Nitrosocosmicus sp.]
MTFFKKHSRYYYWLAKSFVQKNFRVLIASFIASFFFIFLAIQFFPFINSLLFKKTERIGIVGQFKPDTLPVEISSQISNSLISINNKGEIIPVLAQSWEISNKDKTYRFHLKPNLVWSDGKKFTTKEINYKFKGIQTKIIDDDTIEFNLTHPLSIFPVYLTKPIIKQPLKGVAGLYQVDTFRLSKGYIVSLNLTPNKNDIPYRTYVFYETEDKLTAAYKRGEINMFKTQKKSVVDGFSKWKNTKIERSVNYNQILTLFFNTNSPVLSKDMKDIRKALAYATPDFEDLGEKASGPIPPFSWAFNRDHKEYQLNMERAQSLVKKDLNGTPSAQLNLYTFYDYINTAEQLKQNYDAIGLKTSINVVSYIPQNFDVLLTVWNPPVDPDQYYFWHSLQKEANITNYKNVKIDKLLEDGRSITDLDERKKIYTDFQKVIMDDLPAYFIYYPYVYTISKK